MSIEERGRAGASWTLLCSRTGGKVIYISHQQHTRGAGVRGQISHSGVEKIKQTYGEMMNVDAAVTSRTQTQEIQKLDWCDMIHGVTVVIMGHSQHTSLCRRYDWEHSNLVKLSLWSYRRILQTRMQWNKIDSCWGNRQIIKGAGSSELNSGTLITLKYNSRHLLDSRWISVDSVSIMSENLKFNN